MGVSVRMYRYNRWLFICSLTLVIVSCWQQDQLPVAMPISQQLELEPSQELLEMEPFTVNHNQVTYLVEPLYQYQLYGLVVSYNHHEGGSLHERWNDHLNVSDFCVVWGSNADPAILNQFDFYNGQFTCNFATKDQTAWQRFNLNKLSNNHLLSDDNYIRSQLEAIEIGDQIKLTGYLAKYSNNSGFNRSTSTVRTDTGNGACETLYVTEYQKLSSMSNIWRKLLPIAVVLLLLSLIIHFKAPHKFS